MGVPICLSSIHSRTFLTLYKSPYTLPLDSRHHTHYHTLLSLVALGQKFEIRNAVQEMLKKSRRSDNVSESVKKGLDKLCRRINAREFSLFR